MIVITGWRSTIAAEFRAMLPYGEIPIHGLPLQPGFPIGAERYLFCQGLLRAKRVADQTVEELEEAMAVNYSSIVDACQKIIATTNHVRICIIGSESAYRGSFDGTYATSKKMIHDFIENVGLRTPHQQIVGISPGIVEDAGMTTRRLDRDVLTVKRAAHPKGRFLFAREVAFMANALLYGPCEYVSGTIIRMHGGAPGA